MIFFLGGRKGGIGFFWGGCFFAYVKTVFLDSYFWWDQKNSHFNHSTGYSEF